jgi:hypothetical protein
VEVHLDDHPLPVDDAVAAAVAARLEARIAAREAAKVPPRGRSAPWLGIGAVVSAGFAALAAASLLVARPTAIAPSPEPAVDTEAARLTAVVSAPVVARQVTQHEDVVFPKAERSLQLEAGAVALTSERGRAAVALVVSGDAASNGVAVPAGHWALLTRVGDGEPVTVVFRDGEAPPPLPDAVWGDTVHAQLEAVRWASLPARTLEALEALELPPDP